MNTFGELPFSRKSDRKKEKSVVSLTHEQNIIAAKYSWTTLRMSRPLFASNDNARYFHVISCIFGDIFIEPSALMAYIPLCGFRGVVRKNNTF